MTDIPIPEHEKKMMTAGFDHPCKGNCSGWQQGYERGVFDSGVINLKKEVKQLEADLAVVVQFFNMIKDCEGCMYIADEALSKLGRGK